MIRTDLALEAKEMYDSDKVDLNEGVDAFDEDREGIRITCVEIKNEKGEKALGKAKGKYVTLQMPEFEKIGSGYYNVCVECLKEHILRLTQKENPFIFVVGLGNRKITPDAVGPICVDNLIVTHHLHEMKLLKSNDLGNICAVTPGVLGITGIESADIVKSIAQKIKPDLIICIDTLVARNLNRLATTIQLTDTGISPGSGIGNMRSEISEKTMGVKVIAIGVPTVVEAATIAYDAASDSFDEELYCKIKNKTGDFAVVPKDIDNLVIQMSKIIAAAINTAFHNINLEDLYLYS